MKSTVELINKIVLFYPNELIWVKIADFTMQIKCGNITILTNDPYNVVVRFGKITKKIPVYDFLVCNKITNSMIPDHKKGDKNA